jgi:hypothetical protein
LLKNGPQELIAYLNYCKGMAYEQEPDYHYLTQLFKDLILKTLNDSIDYRYDWVTKSQALNHVKIMGITIENAKEIRRFFALLGDDDDDFAQKLLLEILPRFDLTKDQKINCANRKESEKAIFINSIIGNKEKYKNTKIFGFPYTNKDPKFFLKNQKSDEDFRKLVMENIIDVEKLKPGEAHPESVLDFSKNNYGELKINLIKNETLSKERKKLENPKSLFKNLLIIYIDSASRIQFKRGLKNLFNFLESFMKKTENKKQNYNVYQFFKYHSLGSFTHINVQPMFYGNSMISNKGIEFIKYYKENGFITGFSLGMCSPEVFNDKYSTYTKNVEKINWDHESNVLFCDPNFYDKEFGGTSYKGSNCFSKRMLYGKQVNEIQIEYAKQFWEKYKDFQKMFKLCSMDGHEDKSETIKLLDEPLTNFLNKLYLDNILYNISIFIVSDHGLFMPRIHLLFSKEQFIHDKNLPLMLLFYDNNFLTYFFEIFVEKKNNNKYETIFTSI